MSMIELVYEMNRDLRMSRDKRKIRQLTEKTEDEGKNSFFYPYVIDSVEDQVGLRRLKKWVNSQNLLWFDGHNGFWVVWLYDNSGFYSRLLEEQKRGNFSVETKGVYV